MLIPASERVDRRMAMLSNQEAALWLHQQQDPRQSAALHTKTAEDPFLLAASVTPRRYRASFQQGIHASPNARNDAESTERDKWITVLASVL